MNRIIALVLLIGCGSPTHLQYDHGRASNQAFSAQGDLARPEVVDAVPVLQGAEALLIRAAVHQKTTDTTTGKPEVIAETGLK
jgi:hypothetical protein